MSKLNITFVFPHVFRKYFKGRSKSLDWNISRHAKTRTLKITNHTNIFPYSIIII